ncbi:MAG TPA: ABC transporter permease [Candidatus Dormibacteraeota bacterium]|nr:ABC transporter permease [Candidatus Dormibacteraeota bacterium]
MAAYLVRRFFGALVVLGGVAVAVFLILHLTGDPALVMLPPDASRQDIINFRHEYGFDKPVLVQFAVFAAHAVRGDFGTSIRHGDPAMSLALQRLPATAELAFAALVLAVVVAIPAGIIAAQKRESPLDYLVRLLALIGQAAPVYWLGIMLILVFGVGLQWFPIGGRGGWDHLVLPTFTLGAFTAAKLMRITRSGMLDVSRLDYVRTAWAKGLAPLAVTLKHTLRNAVLPIVTVIGLELGNLLSGAVITETIFSWPGIGRLAVQAIYDRDYPVVEAIVVLTAAIFVGINLLVDITYAALDPRVTYG